MCYDVLCFFGNLSCFWSCACQPFDFGVQAFASEAVSACNFLGQPTLFMCQTSFISARVNKTRNWFPMNFETSSNFGQVRATSKEGLGGFLLRLKT